MANGGRNISGGKLLKLMVSHEDVHKMLGLPADVEITSMHTIRGEDHTGIYLTCERFAEVPAGAVTPEATIHDIENTGIWDGQEN